MKRQRLAARRKAMGLSQERLAELLGVDRSTVVRWERAETEPQPWHRPNLATALHVSLDQLSSLLADVTPYGLAPVRPGDLAAEDLGGQDDRVERRSFLPLATLPVVGGWQALAEVLTPFGSATTRTHTEPPLTFGDAVLRTRQAKVLYQACQYERALQRLPVLLNSFDHLLQTSATADAANVHAVASDAFHVVGSIMLKLDDVALAVLAAQRAAEAAVASGDLVAMTSGARILTHALMSTGHAERAIAIAQAAAAALRGNPGVHSTPAGLSVLGALVLRAAVAAARLNDRAAALEMIAEADVTATNLGHDGNDRWTGFGPSNVQLHRVNILLTLGDAGSAIEQAQKVDIGGLQLAERKASLYTDVARAYVVWGKPSQALAAMERAYSVAPEEVRSRPAGQQIFRDLLSLSRGPVKDRAMGFAYKAGLAGDF